jgi:nucleotide-binding universal stress UspA family protein
MVTGPANKGDLVYRKIVIGWDGSEQSRDALALGRRLVGDTGAKLVVANV